MMPLVCCLLMAVTSFAPTPNVESHESTLIALERMWDQAQVSQDVSAMEDLVADRFINTEWDGVVTNRAGFLADIKNPRLKPTFTSIEAVQVNLYGDTAIVIGTYHTKGSHLDKPYDHRGRFTDTWILTNGKWRCVAAHASLISH